MDYNSPMPHNITFGKFDSNPAPQSTGAEKIPATKLVLGFILTLLGPGLGHFVIKQKKRGMIILGLGFVYLIAVVIHMSVLIQDIKKDLVVGVIVPGDPVQTALGVKKITESFLATNGPVISFYEWLGVLFFVGSLADLVFCYFKKNGPGGSRAV